MLLYMIIIYTFTSLCVCIIAHFLPVVEYLKLYPSTMARDSISGDNKSNARRIQYQQEIVAFNYWHKACPAAMAKDYELVILPLYFLANYNNQPQLRLGLVLYFACSPRKRATSTTYIILYFKDMHAVYTIMLGLIMIIYVCASAVHSQC